MEKMVWLSCIVLVAMVADIVLIVCCCLSCFLEERHRRLSPPYQALKHRILGKLGRTRQISLPRAPKASESVVTISGSLDTPMQTFGRINYGFEESSAESTAQPVPLTIL